MGSNTTMDSQAITSPCSACDCTDSPLSITGNLTGILTFALVVWASIVYCFRSVRDFEQEMHEMQHRVQTAFEETQRLRRTFIEQQRTSAPCLSRLPRVYQPGSPENVPPRQPSYLIDEAWARTEKEMIKAAKFINKRLLKPANFLGLLGRKAAYVVEREKAAETVERLERAVDNVKSILTNVLGPISAETDNRLVKVEMDMANLRRQNDDLCDLMKQVVLFGVTARDIRIGADDTTVDNSE